MSYSVICLFIIKATVSSQNAEIVPLSICSKNLQAVLLTTKKGCQHIPESLPTLVSIQQIIRTAEPELFISQVIKNQAVTSCFRHGVNAVFKFVYLVHCLPPEQSIDFLDCLINVQVFLSLVNSILNSIPNCI